MHSRMQDRAKSYKKPMLSISIEKHDSPDAMETHDQLGEENMLHQSMAKPVEDHSEESELSIPGDDVEGRRAMMRRFGK